MEKKPKSDWGPSFFKVLRSDFTKRLRLPPVFVQNYGEFLHGSAKLRSSLGETWNVKISEEIYGGGEKYWCFVGGGWRKFVTDLELDFEEFLIFVFNVSKSTFDVSVYGTNWCERRISTTAEGDCGSMGGNMSFRSVMQSYNRYMLELPMAFAVETEIAGKSSVKLRNVKGKEWVVAIVKCDRFRLTKGWGTFFVENRLKVGGKYLFEFDPSSGNLVLKKEGEFSETEYNRVSAKRGRGRPPNNMFESEDDSEIVRGKERRRRKNISYVESEPDSIADGDDDSEF